jgi:hypothetical protein
LSIDADDMVEDRIYNLGLPRVLLRTGRLRVAFPDTSSTSQFDASKFGKTGETGPKFETTTGASLLCVGTKLVKLFSSFSLPSLLV